jgi:hypothetical protein
VLASLGFSTALCLGLIALGAWHYRNSVQIWLVVKVRDFETASPKASQNQFQMSAGPQYVGAPILPRSIVFLPCRSGHQFDSVL